MVLAWRHFESSGRDGRSPLLSSHSNTILAPIQKHLQRCRPATSRVLHKRVVAAKKGGKEAIHANEQPDEDPLVAVILADSYDEHFTPLTLGTPRCLLPLANVPLIDYSIESATVTGVNHIYILACAHSNQIRQHVSGRLQATLRNQGIGITVMSTPEARSEGDALRELDAKQVLRSDFLLYRADSVCTFDLKRAVAEHKRRRKVDKDVIMTMCCMPVQEQTEMRCVVGGGHLLQEKS